MKIHNLLLLFFLPFLAGAQSFENLPVNFIDQSTGLLSHDNRFCFKDSKGFLWFSSEAGLHRFDGNQVIQYQNSESDTSSVKGQNINGLFFEDGNNNIWFSSTEAINCYVRKEDSFNSFTYPGSKNGIYFVFGMDSLRQLWLYCDSLLLTFNIDDHTFRIKTKIINGAQRALMRLDQKGNVSHVFIYTLDRSHPGFQMLEFISQEKISSSMHFTGIDEPAFPVRDLYIQNDSVLWMACRGGIYFFHLFKHSFQLHNPLPGISDIYINTVKGLNDSVLLLTSYSKGTFTFNTGTKAFTHYYQLVHNDQVVSAHPQAVYIDPDKGVWISILGKGIAFYHPSNHVFRNYQHKLLTALSNSGINPNTFIELPDQRIWGSSNSNGGFIMNNASEISDQYYKDTTSDWPANNTFISDIDSKGNIWTITADAACVRFSDGKVITLSSATAISLYTICKSPPGHMILGSLDGGLFRSVESGHKSIQIEKIPEVRSTTSFTFLYLHSDNKIYAAAYQSHIEVYDPLTDFIRSDSIPFRFDVMCMEPNTEGTAIFMGTNRGLYLYHPDRKSFDSLKWAGEISNLAIFGIVPENENRLWLSTNNGIYSLDMEKRDYTQYGLENGSGTLIFNRHAYLRRTNGEIWFGSNDGITVVDPRHVDLKLPLGKVLITKLLVNDAADPHITCSESGSTNISEFLSIRLPYNNNTISLEFAAISYSGINKSEYEYRLLNYEDEWVQTGNRGFARYANLPHGHYTFEVRIKNLNQDVDGPIRSLNIVVIPPLVQRWWFIALSIFMISALLIWMYGEYEKRKQKFQQLEFEKRVALETERLRIANDMHDDLGSGLSALSLKAKLMAEQPVKLELQSQLQDFANTANRLTQSIRETIWTINSKNDTIDNLVTHLHQYALEYFNGTPVDCQVEIMQEQILTSMPGSHRREIYLAFKEALHNIQKHAAATEVNISIRLQNEKQLVIRIQDNGNGFDLSIPSKGIGLASMEKHMHNIGGQFQILADATGTTVTLSYAYWKSSFRLR